MPHAPALNRRHFLGTAAAGAAATLLKPSTASAASPAGKPRVKLGISTYSYWHFRDPKVPIEHVIDEAARL
ncbi:MAG TPA: xylose isomerase, partial [Verrucomicrobiales bacterium]|nr:xylose isomerase [Verrucomicrobiales bacterium]